MAWPYLPDGQRGQSTLKMSAWTRCTFFHGTALYVLSISPGFDGGVPARLSRQTSVVLTPGHRTLLMAKHLKTRTRYQSKISPKPAGSMSFDSHSNG
ncbi:MAG: hypothetical protein HS126_00040 [Anaerolineales bacterium]|nr:hypothetical protein [Anaerolineales bacterium]